MNERWNYWRDKIFEETETLAYVTTGKNVDFVKLDFESAGASSPPSEDVRDFVEKLRHDTDRNVLVLSFYLLNPALREFVYGMLPRLVKYIQHSNDLATEKSNRGVRGKLNGPETKIARKSGMLPKGEYIVSRPYRSADIPENRLIVYFLNRIWRDIRDLEAYVGTEHVPRIVLDIKRVCEVYKKSPIFSEIGLPKQIGQLEIQRAKRSKMREYRHVSRLVTLRRRLGGHSEIASKIQFLRTGWLFPFDEDDLFELYSLLQVVRAVRVELGFGAPKSYGLLRAGRTSVAEFRSSGGELEISVFFDQSFKTILEVGGRYHKVLAHYERLSGYARRPDIVLVCRGKGITRVCIIEVKRSVDRAYQRDSVYKMFGYFYDFEEVWGVGQKPKGIVIFPEEVGSFAEARFEEDLILVSVYDGKSLAKGISRSLCIGHKMS